MTFLPNSPHARDVASIVHPQTNVSLHAEVGPTIMAKGEGVYVYDDEGNRYLESVAGLWSASLGFNLERLAKVAYDRLRTLGAYHTFRHNSNEDMINLSEKLLEIAPVPMSKVLYQCSGSEANDTACKLVWYYHNAIGKPEKNKIIARQMGYHGSTATAVSLSGKPDMHADFNLPYAPFRHTDFPHYYRFHEDGESEEEFASRCADNLEKMILEEGPETVGAFFAEPVQGAGGAVVPPKTYFEKIQAVLRKYDVLFVADEVICGFGRTGRMWGSETFDLKPDMLSCAKALSAGSQPISALLVNEKIYEAMIDQSNKLGNFAHGYTYAGHPVTTAVALETQKIYEEMDIVGHVQRVGRHLQDRLDDFEDHPMVGEVRGVGLLCGIELVQDKTARKPFDADLKVGERYFNECRSRGMIGRYVGDRVVLAPPLIITESEVDEMVDIMTQSFNATWAEVKDEA
jgi:4-aminobutyrate--pyruvate transaminase